MKKIFDYVLCAYPDVEGLNTRVRYLLKAGWELHGDPSVCSNNGKGYVYSQAMVKWGEVKKDEQIWP